MNTALLAATFAAVLAITEETSQRPSTDRRVYVIVHGAWGGSFAFRKVDDLLTALGHRVFRPSLTGQGERVHLASPDVSLSTHIQDVVNAIVFEDLKDIVLVGHSYGGMVISGVAERLPERIHRLVYLDAFVPENGESVMTLRPNREARRAWLEPMIHGGFLVPPWIKPEDPFPRDVPQSLKTFTEPVSLRSEAARRLPVTYILTMERDATIDDFSPFAERARERGWTVQVMEADHNPEWSNPADLAARLAEIP